MTQRDTMKVGFKLGGKLLEDEARAQSSLRFGLRQHLPVRAHQVHVHASASLAHGTHAINLTHRAVNLGIQENTHVNLEVICRENEAGALCVEHASIDFNHPLHIEDVFSTLDEVSVLIIDSPSKLMPKINHEFLSKAGDYLEKKAGSYLEKIADSKPWKRFKEAADIDGINANLKKSKELLGRLLEKSESMMDDVIEGVNLSKIEVIAEGEGRDASLRIYLSGEVIVSEKLRAGFKAVRLPEQFLPRFDVQLSKLLDQFYVDPSRSASLSKSLLAMLESAEGSFASKVSLYPFSLEFLTRESREITLGVALETQHQLMIKYDLGKVADIFALGMELYLEHSEDKVLNARANLQARSEAIVAFGQSLAKDDWNLVLLGHGQDIQGRIVIERDCTLLPESLGLTLVARDARLKDCLELDLGLTSTALQGTVDFSVCNEARAIYAYAFSLNLHGQAHWKSQTSLHLDNATTQFDPLQGEYRIEAVRKVNGKIRIHADAKLDFLAKTQIEAISVPEFKLNDPQIDCQISGHVGARLRMQIDTTPLERLIVSFAGTGFKATCHHLDVTWNHLSVVARDSIHLEADTLSAALSDSGITESLFDLMWHSEESPQFCVATESAPILCDDLRQGHLRIRITERGLLRFEGGDGFFDAHFFNTLLYPETERQRWPKILANGALATHVQRLVCIFMAPISGTFERLHQRYTRWRHRCDELGLLSTRHLVHIPNLAKVIALFLFDDTRHVEEITQIIDRIQEGNGLDRYKAEALLDAAFPEENLTQIGPILRWFNRLVTPVSFISPKVQRNLALCDDPQHLDAIVGLPTANALYDGDWRDGKLARQCFRYAAGFSLDQLAWLIDNRTAAFDAEALKRLNRLLAIKTRIRMQSPQQGSLFIQDINIDFFLQELLDAEAAILDRDLLGNTVSDAFRTWLCPKDVAFLIAAGISSRFHGQFVQVNQAKLFEYLLRRGRVFTMAVLYEIGQQSVRILTGMLISFLGQNQNLLRAPVDRARLLGECLGMAIPHRDAFLPGGDLASESYFDAIYTLAEAINQANDTYEAAKIRIQRYRYETEDAPATALTPKAAARSISLPDAQTLAQLQSKIQTADAAAADIVNLALANETPSEVRLSEARTQYAAALELAREILHQYPEAWQTEIFKHLWQRIYEAILIDDVYQNILENAEETRAWLARRTGHDVGKIDTLSRVECLHAILHALFFHEADREALRRDPMTWIRLRAPEGPVNLTILTAMGIITEGKSGYELASTFERLRQTRNIRIVRSDTGTIKALGFNASQIETALLGIDGPFVMLGYSQGCANMMRTESNLYSSTPEKREKLHNLLSRQFLYSALNGSIHAVCGGEKYRRLIIDGESLMKSFSASSSRSLSRILFDILRRVLDAPLFTGSLSGVESLSYTGLSHLSRDAQHPTHVISTELQAVAETYIPESLVFMQRHFKKQQSDQLNDSQVGTDCAHSYHVYNRNDSVDILRKQAIPSRALAGHHWLPLLQEVTFLETEQDRRDYVYRGPKDFHVLPWIECLILFGKVPIITSGEFV